MSESVERYLNTFEGWLASVPKDLSLTEQQILLSKVSLNFAVRILNQFEAVAAGGHWGPGPRYLFGPTLNTMEAVFEIPSPLVP